MQEIGIAAAKQVVNVSLELADTCIKLRDDTEDLKTMYDTFDKNELTKEMTQRLKDVVGKSPAKHFYAAWKQYETFDG